MRKILFAIAAFAVVAFSTSANAQMYDRRGFPIAPVQYPTVGCANPAGCALYNAGSPHAGYQVPDYRAPYTRQNVYGQQMDILPSRGYGYRGGYGNGGYGGYGYGGYGVTSGYSSIGAGGFVQQARRPNPIKRQYLADCARNGAPVTQTGGGGMNCHRDASVVTIID